MDFVDEVDFLVFRGIVEGNAVLTLFNLLRSHQKGLIGDEEMQREIDSFKSEFYQKLLRQK
ncbi:MAG: hypothetical protein KME10_23715 [Plectolyngbya sp. WJT66-NPBG17]|jgi:hypothetical protein|nr:hypothetical protein [Plectolyngbya sp. WJT66-NPBG17]MBW4528157.1 hypothetical protein [Phormidium tanganyikae FI6-MK23]